MQAQLNGSDGCGHEAGSDTMEAGGQCIHVLMAVSSSSLSTASSLRKDVIKDMVAVGLLGEEEVKGELTRSCCPQLGKA